MIILGLLIGGAIGTVVALRIQMTALPQLVAAFHSLVGMAAVFVATAALYHPEAYGIGTAGNIHAGSLVEMSLGVAIGAITFSGSVIAFLKLQGLMSGNPITFPFQHPLNAVIGALIVLCIIWFCATESYAAYWAAGAAGVRHRLPDHHPDRRRRHAGGRLDAQLLLGVGGGRHRLHPRQPGAGDHRRAGRLVGRHPQLHHVQGDEPLDLQRAARRLRRRGRAAGGRRRRRATAR